MKRVYKYAMPNPGFWRKVALPTDAAFCRLTEQAHQVKAWFLVKEDAETFERHFCLVETGAPVPDHYIYYGTVPFDGYTWHLMEDTLPPADLTGRDYVG
jgi:hypothetical protein